MFFVQNSLEMQLEQKLVILKDWPWAFLLTFLTTRFSGFSFNVVCPELQVQLKPKFWYKMVDFLLKIDNLFLLLLDNNHNITNICNGDC